MFDIHQCRVNSLISSVLICCEAMRALQEFWSRASNLLGQRETSVKRIYAPWRVVGGRALRIAPQPR